MYTQCPVCATVFAVRPEQLDAAAGRVRCGACGRPFDALLYLVEEISPGQAGRGPAGAPGAQAPAVQAPEASPAYPPPPMSAVGRAAGASADLASPAAGDLPAGRWAAAPGGPGATPAVPAAASPPRAPGAAVQPRLARPPVPEPLQADLAGFRRRRSVARRLGALVAIVALLGLLALQVAWLTPTELLTGAPFVRPWLDRLDPWLDVASSSLGWDRPPPRDPGRIRVLDRDIREHPARAGALLVHATLVNDASFAQSAPRVRLTLFDVNGGVLARRVFLPGEYLPAGDQGLEVARQGLIQVRLELLAPPAPAVSYQIEFL